MCRIDKRKYNAAKLDVGITSDKELAELAHVGVNTLSRMNNGGRVTLRTLVALAKVLRVDPAELMAEEA